jgi:hypothetical protein
VDEAAVQVGAAQVMMLHGTIPVVAVFTTTVGYWCFPRTYTLLVSRHVLTNYPSLLSFLRNSRRSACTDRATEMDQIEKSNLSRQFLFRNSDINRPKSTTAVRAVTVMSPAFHTVANESKVRATTCVLMQ